MKLVNPYEYKPLSRIETGNFRCYDLGNGFPVPSVTTILDATTDKAFLEEWKERVGEAEAKKISEQSSSVGTQIHLNLENYIKHGTTPSGKMLERLLSKLLIDKALPKITDVWGLEAQLYVTDLYAGTADMIALFNSVPSICDFKNSRKFKKKEWIENYFLQLVFYGHAHNTMFGTNINQGVVMVATWDGVYQEFVINGDEWKHYEEKMWKRLEMFYSQVIV
jgi:genome maintenance exonuclease 1